jgi:hypothetical protein
LEVTECVTGCLGKTRTVLRWTIENWQAIEAGYSKASKQLTVRIASFGGKRRVCHRCYCR